MRFQSFRDGIPKRFNPGNLRSCPQVVEKVFSEQFFDMWRAYGEEYRVHVRLAGLPISDSLRDLR